MEKRAHSGGNAEARSNVRFGPFELDLRSGVLYKGGRKVRLQEQPFQILRMLLESPGEVVSREKIREGLWPDDTIVEFEHSINAAVKRLRDALRESADNPRYIKTIARRGYSFIGELDAVERPVSAKAVDTTARTEPADQVLEPVTVSSAQPHFHQPRVLVVGLLALVVVMAGVGLWYYARAIRPSERPLQPLMRFDIDLWNDTSAPLDRGANAILSPDGMRLVYVSQSRLFARMLDQPNARELPGTEGAQAPFFSPDGKWVAFFAGGMLKRMPITGGPPTVICHSFADGGSWDEQGIIFGGLNFVLSRVSSTGGAPVPVTKLLQGEVVHRWPQILPGGKAVLFSAYSSLTGLEGANIELISLVDHRQKTLVRGGTWGHYLPDGYLVYVNNGSLFAARFDADRLEAHGGAPTLILEGVASSSAWGSAQLDFSRTGTLVYRDGRPGSGLVTVQLLDESGNKRSLLPSPGNYLSPTLSPDGNRLALISSGDVWVYDLQRAAMVRLTFGGGYGNPVWTADGRYIVFRAARGMLWTGSDGTGQPQPLMQSNNQQVPWSFTADGKRLAYVESNSTTGADIWTVTVDSNAQGLRAGKPEVFLQTRFDERSPMISPDGRWLAYVSNESGDYQVYVQRFPDKGNKTQVSTDHGAYPAWSHSGHELFFWNFGVNHHLMVAEYKLHGDSFVGDKPRVWYEKGLVSFSTTRSYDPTRDGKHAVALMPADTPQVPQNHVILLLNFFDELRRRVPFRAN